MLLHYLEKLEIQIFCRYSADMEENANKLHFKCTDFNSSSCVSQVYLCVNRIFKIYVKVSLVVVRYTFMMELHGVTVVLIPFCEPM